MGAKETPRYTQLNSFVSAQLNLFFTLTTMTATKPIHVLRRVLRNLKTTLPPELAKKAPTTGVAPTRAYVLDQYRASRQVSCPKETEHLRRLASEFLALQEDLKERNRLYELDTGAETVLTPMEMSRRAAARAGLQLPDLNPKLD